MTATESIQAPASPARRKNGRPTKFTRLTRARVLSCVKKGMPLVHAANAAGISFMSLNTYRQKHLKFADALAQAISKGVEKRLEIIERALDSQDESIRLRAACWFLEHTQPSHFARNRIELTGADGQQLAAGVTLYLPQKENAVVEGSVVTVAALTEGGTSELA